MAKKLTQEELKTYISSYIQDTSNIEHPDNFLLLTKEEIFKHIKTLYENTEKEIMIALNELKKEKMIKSHDIEKRIYIANTEKGKELIKHLRSIGICPLISSDMLLLISFALVFYFFTVMRLFSNLDMNFLFGSFSLFSFGVIIAVFTRALRNIINSLIWKFKKEDFFKTNKKMILSILTIAIIASIILTFIFTTYAAGLASITAILGVIFVIIFNINTNPKQ